MDQSRKEKIIELLAVFASRHGGVKAEPPLSVAEKIADELKNMTDEAIVKEWKDLIFMNEIVGNVSLSDLRRIAILETEMSTRDRISPDELRAWHEEAEENYRRKGL